VASVSIIIGWRPYLPAPHPGAWPSCRYVV
jgi:hypothetical protein